EPLKALSFSNLLSSGFMRIDPALHENYAGKLQSMKNTAGFEDQSFTRDPFASYIIEVFTSEAPGKQPWKQAFEAGLVDEELYGRIDSNRELVRAEGYYAAHYLFNAVETGKLSKK